VRVVAESSQLSAVPGSQVRLDLTITNTSELIDGIAARVVGLDDHLLTCLPALLPLFPEAEGRMTLVLDVPPLFAAGTHDLTATITSSIPGNPAVLVDFTLVVKPKPSATLTITPPVRRARRRAQHLVECHNTGNVELSLVLTAADAERLLVTDFTRAALVVQPGGCESSMLTVRAPRHLFGGDLDRAVALRAFDVVHDVEGGATAILRQRPLIARGVLTVAVLVVIMGLWAGAFALGLTQVLSNEPIAKLAPASFFTAPSQLSANQTPLDAPTKDGALPPGVGGGFSGTVKAASTGKGTGRVVVEALRQGRQGLESAAAAATQSDGSYLMVGLLPGTYYLKFTALGFNDTYYPSVKAPAGFPSGKAPAGARPQTAAAQSVTQVGDTTIAGRPATLTGTVFTGAGGTRSTIQVTAYPLTGSGPSAPVHAVVKATGDYAFPPLAAPASYQLTFSDSSTDPNQHFAPTSLVENLTAGQVLREPRVRLSAGEGSISGTLEALNDKDVLAPRGGVTVSTSQNGQTLSTLTPTTGQGTGTFSLAGLATPGTYIVSFSAPGFGSSSKVVTLAAGQHKDLKQVRLTSGSATVTGSARSGTTPLGGVTVTLGGGPAPLTTTTLTDTGEFSLSGLAIPGTYTLTFTLSGYGPQTRRLSLADAGTPTRLPTVDMVRSRGRLMGTVKTATGAGIGGATVSVSDGQHVLSTTSTAGLSSSEGDYVLPDLPFGHYTLTVTYQDPDGGPANQEQSELVEITTSTKTCDLYSVPPGPPKDPPPCT
jgi:hypothetical protein